MMTIRGEGRTLPSTITMFCEILSRYLSLVFTVFLFKGGEGLF
jgi:hypothetical protein